MASDEAIAIDGEPGFWDESDLAVVLGEPDNAPGPKHASHAGAREAHGQDGAKTQACPCPSGAPPDPQLASLTDILGGECSEEDQRLLLAATNGDVQAAVALFFDKQLPRLKRQQASSSHKASTSTLRPNATARPEVVDLSAADDENNAAGPTPSPHAAHKRPRLLAASPGSGGGAKGVARGGRRGARGPAGGGQRRITAFLQPQPVPPKPEVHGVAPNAAASTSVASSPVASMATATAGVGTPTLSRRAGLLAAALQQPSPASLRGLDSGGVLEAEGVTPPQPPGTACGEQHTTPGGTGSATVEDMPVSAPDADDEAPGAVAAAGLRPFFGPVSGSSQPDSSRAIFTPSAVQPPPVPSTPTATTVHPDPAPPPPPPQQQLVVCRPKADASAAGRRFSPTATSLGLRQYDPVEHACWGPGEPAPFMHLAHTFAVIDATTKRLEISSALTNCFRSLIALSPDDVVPAVYLCTGRIGAAHLPDGEMNVGGATVAAALREVTGVTRARMSQLYSQLGDLGDVAQACKRSQGTLRPPAPLTIRGLMRSLRAMARDTGDGSAGRRQRTVVGLLRCTRSDAEMKYLVRLLIQNLRVGANWKSVVGPLARAVTVQREGPGHVTKARLDAAARDASEAYHLCPSWDVLVPALLEGGVEQLKTQCAMVPGVPIKPQLARICEGLTDALRLLGPGSFLAEHKYDGRRAQIHLTRDGQVKIFSRNSEDSTAAFPDVVQVVRAAAGVAGEAGGRPGPSGEPAGPCVVLDAEIVGVQRDPGTGAVTRLRAFQELATRARGEVAQHQVTMPVCVFVFDLLHHNGETLLRQPLRQRLARLPAALPHMRPGFIQAATHTEVVVPDFHLGRKAPATATRAVLDGQPAALNPEEGTVNPGDHPIALSDSGDGSEEAEEEAGEEAGGEVHGSGDEPDVQPLQLDPAADVAVAPPQAAPAAVQGDATQAPGLPGSAAGAASTQVLDVLRSTQPGHPAVGADAPPAFAPSLVVSVSTQEAAEQLLMDSMIAAHDAGAEGLMLKRLDGPAATYEPSKRSDAWIKLKRDYCEGLRDSLDLVVIGAWQGNGRKVAWLSPFLLAAWDPATEQLQSVCRCMSGFTDAFYMAATQRLLATALPGPTPYFNTGEHCDFWFEPKEVWEIRGAELSLSPVHRAAAGRVPGSERGLALRFPRFIRTREDKGVEDATHADQLAAMYLAQQRRAV